MQKRLPLALVLILAFYWLYVGVLRPPPPRPPPGEPTVSAPPQVAESRPLEPVLADLPAGELATLEGNGFRAEFSSMGGGMVSLRLHDFHSSPEADDELPLVGGVDGEVPSLLAADFDDRYGLSRSLWAMERQADGKRLRWEQRTADGLRFERQVEVLPLEHSFALSLTVTNEGSAAAGALTLVLDGPRGLVDQASSVTLAPTAVAVVQGMGAPTTVTWAGGELKEGTARTIGQDERLLAAGVTTNYFAMLLVPEPGTHVSQVQPEAVVDQLEVERAVAAQGEPMRAELEGKIRLNASVRLLLSTALPAPGESARFAFRVYAGPRDTDLAQRPEFAFLAPVIEKGYGRFAFINKGLLAVLKMLHSLTHNWGVAIILLTLLVRVLLFPLNRKQQTSMSKYAAVMQRLKPELDALKAKHKSNKRKFAEEQMKLLQQHGVRPPLGGCLLTFVQLPIWISLWQILRSAIELRHADFALWIHDLSGPDRMPLGLFGLATLNLLPILTSAAMVLQMSLQPKPADEAQAQSQKLMMMIMPVMFLWFLYSNPSGLSLYILTSSLLGVVEYNLVRRLWPLPT